MSLKDWALLKTQNPEVSRGWDDTSRFVAPTRFVVPASDPQAVDVSPLAKRGRCVPMRESYPVQMEVAGPAAMFARPDSGATYVSYPAPTFSAVKGMFEAVARVRGAWVRPTRVGICAPIHFESFKTNYLGPLRKNAGKPGAYQFPAQILVDVVYQLHGEVVPVIPVPAGIPDVNHRHSLHAILHRRLENGQSFRTPVLGWRQFSVSYFGPFRPETEVDESINQQIPSMLFSMWDSPTEGALEPRFEQNVEIERGVLTYAE